MGEIHLDTYTNQFGETWWFDYDKENDMGILWGDDDLIVGEKFYVFDGVCLRLILSKNEKNWLKNTWVKHSESKDLYLNLHTKSQVNNYTTYLENDYCPICLRRAVEFEHHHCVPASEGGSDDVVNVLRICNSCHSLITNGCADDRVPRYLAVIYHQLTLYGISFYKMNPFNNKRYGNQDRGLYENRPYIKETIDYFDSLTQSKQVKYNSEFKKHALYYYKYYRSVVRNIMPDAINCQ